MLTIGLAPDAVRAVQLTDAPPARRADGRGRKRSMLRFVLDR